MTRGLNMSAPKGNQFWKARSSHGRKPIYEDADKLWDACEEYFDWVDANPLKEEKGFAFQGKVTKETFNKMRAMTISGLCIHLGITEKTWFEWRGREDLSNVITRAETIIYIWKFEGAAADLLNANIIARDLGLRDGHEFTGKSGGPLQFRKLDELTDEQLAAIATGRGKSNVSTQG